MDHVRGAPNHPQTQGKIERWHQTLKNRILLENYYLPAPSSSFKWKDADVDDAPTASAISLAGNPFGPSRTKKGKNTEALLMGKRGQGKDGVACVHKLNDARIIEF